MVGLLAARVRAEANFRLLCLAEWGRSGARRQVGVLKAGARLGGSERIHR